MDDREEEELAANERDLFFDDDDGNGEQEAAPGGPVSPPAAVVSSVPSATGGAMMNGRASSRLSSTVAESFVTAATHPPSDDSDQITDGVDDDDCSDDDMTHDISINSDNDDCNSSLCGASVASAVSRASGIAPPSPAAEGGVHMVDHVDPDAVDFTPLHTSLGGAALTPSPSVGSFVQSDDDDITQSTETTDGSGGFAVFATAGLGRLTAGEAASGGSVGVRAAARARWTRNRLNALADAVGAVIESLLDRAQMSAGKMRGEFSTDSGGGGVGFGGFGGFGSSSSSDDAQSSTLPPKMRSASTSGRSAFEHLRDLEVRFRALVLLPLLTRLASASGLVRDGRRRYTREARKGLQSLAGDEDPSVGSSLGVCAAFFMIIVVTSFATSGLGGGGGGGGAGGRGGGASGLYSSEMGRKAGGGGMRLSALGASAGVVDLSPPRNTPLPGDGALKNVVANVDDLPLELMDTAVFWHVPRSGGTTMKHVMATCLGRVITSEVGGQEGHAMDERLEIVQKPYGNFVNVDTTTPLGLKRAADLGLAPSRIADVVFTPYVHEATVLFDHDHRGRFFTMLRDPVSRIQSLYYFRRMNGGLGEMTLEDFVRDTGENWMVRTLTGTMSGQLDVAKLNQAKEVLRTKFLVGIFAEKTETLRRIESYFGWKFPSPVAQNCKNQLYYFEWHSKNPHPEVAEDDEVALLIQRQNRYDMELYEYALQLFREQEKFFWGGELGGGNGGGAGQEHGNSMAGGGAGTRGADKVRRRI